MCPGTQIDKSRPIRIYVYSFSRVKYPVVDSFSAVVCIQFYMWDFNCWLIYILLMLLLLLVDIYAQMVSILPVSTFINYCFVFDIYQSPTSSPSFLFTGLLYASHSHLILWLTVSFYHSYCDPLLYYTSKWKIKWCHFFY